MMNLQIRLNPPHRQLSCSGCHFDDDRQGCTKPVDGPSCIVRTNKGERGGIFVMVDGVESNGENDFLENER